MAAACPRLSVCLSVSAWELCALLRALLASGCASLVGEEGMHSRHGVLQPCHGATAGARRIPGTVAGKGNLWLCSPAGQHGWGRCLRAPAGLLLLCGNEVMSVPGGNGARAAGGVPKGCLPCPSPPQAKGWTCLWFAVRCGPDSLCSLPAPGPR